MFASSGKLGLRCADRNREASFFVYVEEMTEPWDDPPDDPRQEAFGPGLGRAIRVIRAGLDMSRKELSERTGLSRSYVAEIENGRKTPSSRALAALAAALGVEPRGLLEAAERWENEPPPHSYETLRETTLGLGSSDADAPPRTLASRLRSASSRRELLRDTWRRAAAHGETEAPDEAALDASPDPGSVPAPDATPASGSDALSDASEVLEIFARLDADDRERVLDLARRLADA